MKYILCLFFILSSFSAAMAQSSIADQKVMQAQFMRDVNSNSHSSGGGRSNNNNNTISPAEKLRRQRVAEATAANDKGVDFYKNRDWADAVAYFQQAADKDPDDKVIQGNLEKAKQNLQNQTAVANMQQSVNNFAQTLNTTTPSPTGMDFDQTNSNNSSTGTGLSFMPAAAKADNHPTNADLQFGDPNVVDARNVPSGLPVEVENAIPNTTAGGNVRRGFQAIQAHDWNTALGWFKTALVNEPGNTGLMRLVDLAEYTLQRQNKGISGQNGINGVLNDYNQNFLSRYPELKGTNISDSKFLRQEYPAWVPFFRYITSKLSKQTQPDPAHAAALGKRG